MESKLMTCRQIHTYFSFSVQRAAAAKLRKISQISTATTLFGTMNRNDADVIVLTNVDAASQKLEDAREDAQGRCGSAMLLTDYPNKRTSSHVQDDDFARECFNSNNDSVASGGRSKIPHGVCVGKILVSVEGCANGLAEVREPTSWSAAGAECARSEMALRQYEEALLKYLVLPDSCCRFFPYYDSCSFVRRDRDDDDITDSNVDVAALRYRLKRYEKCVWLRKKQQDSSSDDNGAFGSAAHDIADAINGMGNVYMVGKSHNEALLCYKSSLRIRSEAMKMLCSGNDDSSDHLMALLRTKSNIGKALCRMGLYQRALGTFLDIVATTPKQVLGAGAAAQVASTLNRMANVYFKMKSYKLAIQYYEKALIEISSSQQVKWEDQHHGRIIGIVYNIAIAHYKSDNYQQSLLYFAKVLRLQTATDGHGCVEVESDEDIDEAISTAINMMNEKSDDACPEGDQGPSFDVRKSSVVGKGVMDVVRALHYIGIIKCKNQHWIAAHYIFEAVLVATKNYKGDSHADVGKALLDVTIVKIELEEYETARNMCMEALDIFQNERDVPGHARFLKKLHKNLDVINDQDPAHSTDEASGDLKKAD